VESAALFSLSILIRKTMKSKVNEIQISYKEKVSTLKSPTIKCSKNSAELLFKHWNKNTIGLQESFKVLLLNNSNKVKGVYELSNGGITGTLVDLRILFAVILKSLSVGIIISHNHPSNKLKPSEADKRLTEKIKKAAQFFDIMVLDHLIITPDGNYYSFADNGDL
jgi:DNA repair protein RadC